MAIGTTQHFLEHFGYKSLEDLPRPEELPVVLRERVPLGPADDATEDSASEEKLENSSEEDIEAPSEEGVEARSEEDVEAQSEEGVEARSEGSGGAEEDQVDADEPESEVEDKMDRPDAD